MEWQAGPLLEQMEAETTGRLREEDVDEASRQREGHDGLERFSRWRVV